MDKGLQDTNLARTSGRIRWSVSFPIANATFSPWITTTKKSASFLHFASSAVAFKLTVAPYIRSRWSRKREVSLSSGIHVPYYTRGKAASFALVIYFLSRVCLLRSCWIRFWHQMDYLMNTMRLNYGWRITWSLQWIEWCFRICHYNTISNYAKL